MCQQATNGWLEDSGGRSTLSLWQLEVIPEAASGKGKHSQLFQVVLLAASRPFQKLRNRKKGSQNINVGSKKRVLFWFPKTGDNEMEQTVGFHFVDPRFREPNRFQKREPFLKKKHFFCSFFFFQKSVVFFNTNCCVCYDSPFSFLTKGPTKQAEKVRPA